MSTMFADTLLIVFISVCTALLAEGERRGACRACPARALAERGGGLGPGPGPAVPSAGGMGGAEADPRLNAGRERVKERRLEDEGGCEGVRRGSVARGLAAGLGTPERSRE